MSDKVWFKIGEMARLVGATPKELRYWEKVIPELQPRRSKGNLRYYHQEELPRLQRIRQWLDEGFTVSSCRELLLGEAIGVPNPPPLPDVSEPRRVSSRRLQVVLKALRALHARLGVPPGEADLKDPPPPVRERKARATSVRKVPVVVPPPGVLLLEPDADTEVAAIETTHPEAVNPAPKRTRKPKPGEGNSDQLWSVGRLLLDSED